MATKRMPTASASRRAIVVLPVPGGPHRIIEASLPAATIRPIAPSGPVRCSWPTTSSSARGRSRSASGAFSRGRVRRAAAGDRPGKGRPRSRSLADFGATCHVRGASGDHAFPRVRGMFDSLCSRSCATILLRRRADAARRRNITESSASPSAQRVICAARATARPIRRRADNVRARPIAVAILATMMRRSRRARLSSWIPRIDGSNPAATSAR